MRKQSEMSTQFTTAFSRPFNPLQGELFLHRCTWMVCRLTLRNVDNR